MDTPTQPSTEGLPHDIHARTQHLYKRVEKVVPWVDWVRFAPEIDAILRLKRERNAVILAHNYQTPEIFHGVADIVGDSLALARRAAETEAEVIVMAGVHFMAETAKLVNPGKTVLIPDTRAGCSLAESITAADVRLLREKHPGVPVVTYINTSAAVKAECDVCCTSGNAVKVVEALGHDRVILLPDQYLAAYVASQSRLRSSPGPGAARFTSASPATRSATTATVTTASPSSRIPNARPTCWRRRISSGRRRR